MFNKDFLKIICISSLVTGAIIGVIPLIPAFTGLAFITVMFFIAPFIIIYMKRLNLIKTIDLEHSLAIGGLSGAVAFLGFALIYFPIAFILNLIFKIQSFIWIKVLFTNFGFLIPMIILIALLCGLLNMFSGFLTVYIYEYFKQIKKG